MNSRFFNAVVAVMLAVWLAGIGRTADAAGDDGRADQNTARGPHGGRLLTDGDLAVELAIFEAGVPPEYRAWITRGGQPVSPGDVTLTVTLERLDGERNVFRFQPQGDFLRGDGTVTVQPVGQAPNNLVQIDRLKLVAPEPDALVKAADGLFERKDGLAEPPDATVSVVSGMVENSNVNVVNEMTEILAIAREFEIQLRMMQTAEQNDEAASELLRSS